jgi:hypothetical protein
MSELKVKIQIDNILEVESGESANGEWSKVSFIGTQVDAEYPKEIGFEIFGAEKVEKFQQYNKVGDEVEVSFNLQSREYNGKIYTTAQAWKVWNLQTTASAAPEQAGEPNDDGDDLPF